MNSFLNRVKGDACWKAYLYTLLATVTGVAAGARALTVGLALATVDAVRCPECFQARFSAADF